MFSANFFAQSNLVLSSKISASSDDAEEQGANGSSPGTIDLTSSDLELVRDGNDGDQYVGLRFNNISIPNNAIIDSVFIQFTVDEDDTLSGTKIIKAEAVDNSTTFTSTVNNISSRPTTVDSVLWSNIAPWPVVGAAGIEQRTPDLARIVAEVIGRPGWASGNSINIIISGTGERVAEAFDGVTSSAPELIIHYSVPVSASFSVISGDDDAEQSALTGAMSLTSTDLEFTSDGSTAQVIGIRFQNVAIPNGATILEASIQLQVDEVTTNDTVNVAWDIELIDNAPAFTNSGNNIGGRTYSGGPIIWNKIAPWPTVGASGLDQQTPDLSNLLQLVINRPGWVNGNAVAFASIDPSILSIPNYTANAGKRTAESYNGSTSGAAKLVVNYLPPSTFADGSFPIPKGSSWKYDDSGVDLSATNWTDVNYNDSSWAFGNAILGYNNGNETTTVDFGPNSNSKHITTYLRHTFNVRDSSIYDSLLFDVLRDDGVVVYLNGTEIFRQNMPNGTVNFSTAASTAVGGADETAYFRNAIKNALVNGRNVIAVELHQQAATSSDLSFDLEVLGKLPPLATTDYPVASGDEWSYLDNGVDLTASNWKDLNYNDTTWAYGPSPLGYSNPSATTLSFGPDPTNKYITYYFRKRINISNIANLADSLILGVRRDDGAVVYLNGTEVFRTNMPSGAVTYNTTSSSIVSGADENTFFTTTLSKSNFIQGSNIIAVEVHQRDSSSSDLSFDLEIQEKPALRKACSGPNDPHISCFTSLFPTNQGPDFVIPETHAFQVLLEQGDAYTNQGIRTTAPGNNDMTGYIPRTGSSVDGFLGINHENTPGGVSILDIHYVDSTRLWTVDSSQAVDFYNNDLVTTTRNCSGGVTPWGTYISSEETTNAGDANMDGYEDVGWQVEIDPVTRKVKEYGTPGTQEKLWAMGRMSHENIAVANDSMTAYEGEDRGSGCLYKFVANNKMDLSSGTLYALRLDGGLVGGEPVLSTGTWIVIPNTTQADRNTTNSLALSLGATPFNGIEDAEIGTVDGKIYFTSKGNNRVYRFSDDSNTNVSQFETFVGAQSYLINYGSGIVSEPWASGNDNLCFDDLGNLYVLQDGSRDHVWMVAPNHTQKAPQVDIFAKLPAGSEPCGMTFTPDYKFMFLSVQHPSGANSSTTQIDASGYGASMSVSATVVIARKEFLGDYAPTTAATNLSFTASCDSVNLSFTTGNGLGQLVVAKEGSPVNVNPVDGVSYTADPVVGNGDDLGQNSYAVYSGLDSTVTLKGLQKNSTYHISIFDYNEEPNKFYNTELTAADSISVDSVKTSAITGNFNALNGSTQNYSVINTNGSSYNWIAAAGTINSGQGSNQVSITLPATPGSFDLKLVETNADGCIGDTITQTINYGVVGLESFNLSEAISIAPNPSNGRTSLNIVGNTEALDLIIYDAIGKEVLRATNIGSSYQLNLSGHKKGSYILRLASQTKTATKRLIIQ